MTSLLKKTFTSLKKNGLISTFKSICAHLFIFNTPLNKLKLKFFIYLHNLSYRRLTSLARRLNNGDHPKRKILDYKSFFLKNIFFEDSILDIGCHSGYLSFLSAKKAKKVTGIDINSKNISLAKSKYHLSNLEFINADATEYPFKEKFDKIILSNVLEHIENRIEFLNKISHLSDIILIRVPLITRDWLSVYKKDNGFEYRLDPTHFIEYTKDSLKEEISSADLSIKDYSIQFGEFWGILIKK